MLRNRWHSFWCILLAFWVAFVAPVRSDIKVGVIGSVTGKGATYGEQLLKGTQIAVEVFNRSGGILGQKIELLIADDGADPKQGVAAANKFLGENITWAIGPAISSVSLPVSNIYADNNILQILNSATLPQLTERGFQNLFRICGRDDQQAPIASDYLIKYFKNKKIALVHDKSSYGKGMTDVVRQELHKQYVKEVFYDSINLGEKDYGPLISRLKESNVDVLYFGGFSTEAGLIVRQMRDHSVATLMISGDGIANEEFPAVGGGAVEGTLFTYGIDPRTRPEAAELMKKLHEKDVKAEAYVFYAYAAMQILKQAAEQAQSLEVKKMSHRMHSGELFSTVLGPVSFDHKGDRRELEYTLYIWKNTAEGRLVYVPHQPD